MSVCVTCALGRDLAVSRSNLAVHIRAATISVVLLLSYKVRHPFSLITIEFNGTNQLKTQLYIYTWRCVLTGTVGEFIASNTTSATGRRFCSCILNTLLTMISIEDVAQESRKNCLKGELS